MTFLPDAPTLIAYTVACFVLYVTPGPDMSLMLAKTMQGGRKAGMASMLGASAGCLVHSVAAALGLSAIIAASATLFTAMKIIGALYLLWLAYDAIRHGSALRLGAETGAMPSTARTFWMAVGTNLTNPKVVLFFITFLPQFIAAGDAHAAGKLLFLGVYFVAFAIVMGFLLVLVAERFIEVMKASPKVMRAIDYTFAGVFGFFAVHVLRTEAR
ncbi:LysE family translocator [Bradyrhizobium sp. LHD-71]|uniref:LysE family translocator n=1 Tax=Bradyrhizobium sp. LHD-71 TaxID=3072141 RepID=UPI00280DA8CC|nr:LysE family translocator [Bradyrhizobium sp. LHD-71]MDQ8728401.1 LysE family translocator [Bradyrhizobium sp. LHD-71]